MLFPSVNANIKCNIYTALEILFSLTQTPCKNSLLVNKNIVGEWEFPVFLLCTDFPKTQMFAQGNKGTIIKCALQCCNATPCLI